MSFLLCKLILFQSTYLYKVRLMPMMFPIQTKMFQSTYLYKVRPSVYSAWAFVNCFNPRTYIRYDFQSCTISCIFSSFNPRTYIRYDVPLVQKYRRHKSFNPRTYIRYDQLAYKRSRGVRVSIHVPI